MYQHNFTQYVQLLYDCTFIYTPTNKTNSPIKELHNWNTHTLSTVVKIIRKWPFSLHHPRFLHNSCFCPAQFVSKILHNFFFSHNLPATNYATQPRKILIVNCSLILAKLPHLRHLEVCPKLDSFRFCNNSIAKNTEMKMFHHFYNIYNILLSIVIFFITLPIRAFLLLFLPNPS